jgi:hypothetical protein
MGWQSFQTVQQGQKARRLVWKQLGLWGWVLEVGVEVGDAETVSKHLV